MINAANARELMTSGYSAELNAKLLTIDAKVREKAGKCEKETTISFNYRHTEAGLYEVLKHRLINHYGYKCEMKISPETITVTLSWV